MKDHTLSNRKAGRSASASRSHPGTAQASSPHPATARILQMQKTVGNRAVLQMLAVPATTRPSPIQRKITYQDGKKEKELPTTWKKIQALSGDIRDQIDNVLQNVRGTIKGTVDEDKLKKAFIKLAQDDKSALDLFEQHGEIEKAVLSGYNRRMNAKHRLNKRTEEGMKIAEHLTEKDDHLIFMPNARNPMVQPNHLEQFDYDPKTSDFSKTQTHLSTVLLDLLGTGEEVQSSLAKDKSGVFISTNRNAPNRKLRKRMSSRKNIKDGAKEILLDRGLDKMNLDEAMGDRTVRHALKLFDRIDNYLTDDSLVTVPSDVDGKLDGRHAEVRIEQTKNWNEDDYHLPSGTKYPCMSCSLYFHEEGYGIGDKSGPLWTTNPGMSPQMESELLKGMKIGNLGEKTGVVGKRLSHQYGKHSGKFKIGYGKKKDGSYTLDHQADSDSEYEEEDFKKLKQKVYGKVDSDSNKKKDKKSLKRPLVSTYEEEKIKKVKK
ncbi:hypothetical protein ACF3MZ_26215 [Paenibacillaceae bacterium WGS1546]|uniref:hypothetical protein n=1 Tax=Cohnella sp. WGS1546 TaxID=3366810 RepID=UPI00372D3311